MLSASPPIKTDGGKDGGKARYRHGLRPRLRGGESRRDLAKSLAGAGVGFRLSGPVTQNYAVATASGSF